jgi:hypothetical protein
LTERTLSDLQANFGTGTRVRCTIPGFEDRIGIVVMRDESHGAWVLWDDLGTPLHQQGNDFAGLPPRMTAAEQSTRWKAALDCESAGYSQRHIDPFDTGSLTLTGGRKPD